MRLYKDRYEKKVFLLDVFRGVLRCYRGELDVG